MSAPPLKASLAVESAGSRVGAWGMASRERVPAAENFGKTSYFRNKGLWASAMRF